MNRAGSRFRSLLAKEKPLQVVGTINALTAVMAEQVGHKALYVSGAGVANASLGVPDLGLTTLNDVLIDVRRITSASSLPVLVDIDTGFDDIATTIQEMEAAGAAAVHIEDQQDLKRCGHRPNKSIVSTEEMVDRIKMAVNARTDQDFFIMGRTDAFASEGLERSIDRAHAYVEAGADGIFVEAVQSEKHYRAFRNALTVPILANMTEFGKTELYNKTQLNEWGVDMILYPLSAFRAMNKAAQNVYFSILNGGDQRCVLDTMQTRDELYQLINYYEYEKQADMLLESKHESRKT
jgi:methylisocitrate lyase